MAKVVLLNAQAFHRSKPESFPYAPSERALELLRPGMTVRLLAMPTIPGEGGDLWEAKALWAEIDDLNEQGLHATVKTGAPWPGFMEGDPLEFSADRVFDFYGPELWFNPERLPTLVGRTVLLGITILSSGGEELERHQLHGAIRGMESPFGLVVELAGGGLLDLPPTFALLDEAPPGDYRLRSTGEVVVNPDLMSVVTVSLPSGQSTWSGPRYEKLTEAP
jgi:hypothetical protein